MARALAREGRHDEARKYDFAPSTYVLPVDFGVFVEEFKKSPPSATWIMKPINKAQGKGIFLFSKLSQINDWRRDARWKPDAAAAGEVAAAAETYVVQRYADAPLLVGGKKFDVRIYVLVTSYAPLVVYLHREGFARFTSSRDNRSLKSLGDNDLHLTNVAVQKTQPGNDSDAGCKWPLRSLRLHLISRFGAAATDTVFHDMEQLCVRSLPAVQKAIVNAEHWCVVCMTQP